MKVIGYEKTCVERKAAVQPSAGLCDAGIYHAAELLVGAIGTPADSAEDADVSVVMTADQEKCAIGGTANVTLTVTLNNDIDNATIHIALTDQEIEAIQDSFWKTAEEDTGAVLLDESADSAGEVTGTTVTRVGVALKSRPMNISGLK